MAMATSKVVTAAKVIGSAGRTPKSSPDINRVSHDSVNSNRRQKHGKSCKCEEQLHGDAPPSYGVGDELFESRDVVQGLGFVNGLNFLAERLSERRRVQGAAD